MKKKLCFLFLCFILSFSCFSKTLYINNRSATEYDILEYREACKNAIDKLVKEKIDDINFVIQNKSFNYPCLELTVADFDDIYSCSLIARLYIDKRNKIEVSVPYKVSKKVQNLYEETDEEDFDFNFDFSYKEDEDDLTPSEYEIEYGKEIGIALCKLGQSLIPYIENQKTENLESLELIDSVPVGTYYNYEKNFSKNWVNCINVTDDGKFIVNNSLGLTAYDSNGELISVLSDSVPNEYISYNSWKTHIGKNKKLYAVSFRSPYIFTFDEDLNYVSSTKYNFPDDYYFINFISFNNKNEPFLTQTDGPVTKIGRGFENNLEIEIPYSYAKEFVGPDNKIWMKINKVIFVYSENYQLETVFYLNNLNEYGNHEILYVHEDGRFLVRDDDGNIFSYNKNGILEGQSNFPVLGISSCVYKNGIYYVPSKNGKILLLGNKDSKLSGLTDKSKKLNDYLSSVDLGKPFEYKKILDLAEDYKKAKAYWKAYNLIGYYLQFCPGDVAASEKMLLCELEIAKEIALVSKDKALEILDDFGEEAAKEEYSKVIKIIEKFQKLFPEDQQLFEMYNELKTEFDIDYVAAEKTVPAVSVESVLINSIFPSLQNFYSTNPNGSIIVKNNSKNPVKNLTVSTNIRKYMDYASESPSVEIINPGQKTEIQLFNYLNNKILSIPENINSQIQITLTWECNGKKEKMSVTRPITLYNKSAITWADTGILSCFILPEDPIVKKFTYDLITDNKNYFLSKNLSNGISIINGMQQLNLKYVPDPNKPSSTLVNNGYAIDSIKFPSETISLKGGDCDDLTVLFCSLMESAGIDTALITTEGHIFAAFNTGLSFNQIWDNLQKDLLVLNVDGYAWIPVETTVISKGFMESWKKASEELEVDNQSFVLNELTLVSEVRDIYPPVSFNSEDFEVNYNKSNALKNIKTDFDSVKKMFESACENDYKTKDVYDLNSMARIYNALGNPQKAILILNEAIKINPDYKSAYTNLINLYKLTGNSKEASKLQQKSDKIKTDKSDEIKLRAADGTDQWDDKKNKKGVPVRKTKRSVGSKSTSKGERTISTRADDATENGWQD